MPLPEMHSWHKIAESITQLPFAENNIAVVEINGKKICIGRHHDNLYAFAYLCPHASGIMSDGYIDVLGNIVCPSHRYKFNIQDGRNTSGEGYYLRHWAIETKEDGIYISM